MSFVNLNYPEDLTWALAQSSSRLKGALEGRMETLRLVKPGDADFVSGMRRAFEFLRAHAGRHYTPSTMMRVLEAADRQPGSAQPEPYLLLCEQPIEYDPDTEVKTGGTLGVMVQLNDGQSRAVLGVAPGHRRLGVGAALLALHRNALGVPAFWVGRTNSAAQMFLLSQGFAVAQMNSRGALRFEEGGYETEGDAE